MMRQVLLYNFFEDSTVELSQWKVILNALDDRLKKRIKCPQFDDARHSGVCREVRGVQVIASKMASDNMVCCSSSSYMSLLPELARICGLLTAPRRENRYG